MSRKLLVLLLLGLLAIHHVSAVDIGMRLRSKLGLSEGGEESGDDEGSEGGDDSEESGSDEGSEGGDEGSEESSSEGGGAVAATRLQAQEESGEESGSCDQKPACQQQPQIDDNNNKPQKVDPEELVKPIDDWIKGFKKRTSGGGGNDLFENAKATVKPLIDKLRRNQEEAQEKLKEANENILSHVQDATTEHVYQLLKASKKKDDKAEKKEQKKEVAAEKSEEQEQKKEDSELAKKVASEASAAQEISENAQAIKQVAQKAAQKSS